MSTTKRSFKRPFQPSISSCLGHPARDTHDAQKPTSKLTLTTTIQRSLLNVGMRVRKAVPEGYQTRPKISCGLPHAYENLLLTGPVPYCGVLKIGCHNPSPAPAKEDLPLLQFDSDDWEFLSSQESKASCDSIPPIVTVPVASRQKRRCEDEDDEWDVESSPASPRSYPPFSHTRMPNLDQLRPIATPKTRKKPVLEVPELKESEMVDAGDFGEADFFRPDEWGRDWGHEDDM